MKAVKRYSFNQLGRTPGRYTATMPLLASVVRVHLLNPHVIQVDALIDRPVDETMASLYDEEHRFCLVTLGETLPKEAGDFIGSVGDLLLFDCGTEPDYDPGPPWFDR